MRTCRVGVFARKFIGKETIKFLLDNYPQDLIVICLDEHDVTLEKYICSHGYQQENILYREDLATSQVVDKLRTMELDYIILAWWAHIIKKEIIQIPRKGVLNFHNALLPHNAGMHSNFWNIVENRPYGVTIHFVNEEIDAGDIVFQKVIETSWEDTGKTLYDKSVDGLIQLFKEKYPLIREGSYTRKKQDRQKGSFHYGKELFKRIRLDLNDAYTVRDLLNLLRAQNFPPYGGCYFTDDGISYEVQIKIRKKPV